MRGMSSLLRDARVIEQEMVTRLGMEPENFWSEIDDVVVGHFERKGAGDQKEPRARWVQRR